MQITKYVSDDQYSAGKKVYFTFVDNVAQVTKRILVTKKSVV